MERERNGHHKQPIRGKKIRSVKKRSTNSHREEEEKKSHVIGQRTKEGKVGSKRGEEAPEKSHEARTRRLVGSEKNEREKGKFTV